jgi:hypothetical protein
MLLLCGAVCGVANAKQLRAYTDGLNTAWLWYEDDNGNHLREAGQVIVLRDEPWAQEGQIWHTWCNADCSDIIGSIDTYCHGICQRQWNWVTDPNGQPVLATGLDGFLKVTGYWDSEHDNETDHTQAAGGCPAGYYDPDNIDAAVHHQSIHYYHEPNKPTEVVDVWYHRNNKWNVEYEEHWWEYMEIWAQGEGRGVDLPHPYIIIDDEVVIDWYAFFSAWCSSEPNDLASLIRNPTLFTLSTR